MTSNQDQEKWARAVLNDLFQAAVASADPMKCLASFLPKPPAGRCVVVGCGKSAAVMARALEEAWLNVDIGGIVVTRYGHAVATKRIKVLEAAHPVPDDASEQAATSIMNAVSGLSANDLVIALISGGGSSLMSLAAQGLTLDEKRQVNRLLLNSGLAINEINAVRRRLSRIKGGRLAQAVHPARLVTLAISDVPGDDPCAIASGPTVYDPDHASDLSHLARRLGPKLPKSARHLLTQNPTPQERFAADYRLIATPQTALEAAAVVARQHGIEPLLLGDALEGEARDVGTVMAGIARSIRRHGHPISAPTVLLSGGETTVTIGQKRPGRGGRNTEFLLSLGIALAGETGFYALSADTDGIDGSEDAAGAFLSTNTLKKAEAIGQCATQSLLAHDSYSFFSALGDLVITGPTLTNVNDFRAILIMPDQQPR